jgi:hypothetical protein
MDPPDEDEQEKEDMSLQVSSFPQAGQGAGSVLLEEKRRCSNSLPHLLHLNS